MAVVVWQKMVVALLPPVSKFSDSILTSNEPALFTAVLVSGAVIIFPMFVRWRPIRRGRFAGCHWW